MIRNDNLTVKIEMPESIDQHLKDLSTFFSSIFSFYILNSLFLKWKHLNEGKIKEK